MENVLVSNLINKFTDHLTSLGKSKNTAIAYKKDLEQFSGYLISLEKTDIREVKKEDIEGFINKILENNYTKKSASRKLNSIRSFFRYLKNENIIVANPSLDVSHPKYTQQPPRILSKIEYRALRDYAKSHPRNYAIVEVLLQTGMRISELVNLKIEDVVNDHIIIRNKNGNRQIPINRSLKKAIDNYLKTKKTIEKNQPLFTTRTGKPMIIRNIRQIISRCFQAVDINNATVNDLRNTFIAYQLAAGVSADYVAKIVGHKRLSSTERYLSLVPHHEEKKEKLEEL